MRTIQQLVRPNVLSGGDVDSVRKSGADNGIRVRLDANECPYNSPYNRYPDACQETLRSVLAPVKGVDACQICVANGRDEVIDLLYRCFCRPGVDNVVAVHPTYGMYKGGGGGGDVDYRPVLLDGDFQINADRILSCCDGNTKMIWLCSPNEWVGNLLKQDEIETLLGCFDGIVVVDETYIDYAKSRSFRGDIGRYERLVVIDTMSAAWGAAAINVAMAYSNREIISVLNKVKLRHNVSTIAQNYAIELARDPFEIVKRASLVCLERQRLMNAVAMLPFCDKVFESDANFFLARMTDAELVYKYLVGSGIAVCNCSGVALCDNCLRITVGTKNENNELLAALRQY